MSIDVEVLCEVFSIMNQYIPSKDRQECADNLMSVVVDMLGDQELTEFGTSDPTLKRALKEYAIDAVDDEGNELDD